VALLGNLTGSSQFFSDELFYNNVATQSLRFDDGSSAYLNRTFSSSNRKTWTWSGWVKRSSLSGATLVLMYTGSGGGVARGGIVFNSSEQLEMQMNPTGNAWKYIKTNALHRDTSAWYHIVAVLDTTQATESNRQKFYVNGTQQTLSSASYPTLNQDYPFNLGTPHHIGSDVGGGSNFDGYLAETNFVDGTALDASYFGETKNGVWIPKKYTGSYGTNGFRLQFNQTGVGTASTSTIGADTSGNTNHFTSSGIVASDCNMPDSPENNFATWNVLSKGAGTSTAEGNLKAIYSSNNQAGISSTFSVDTGKYYFEVGCQTASVYIGVAPSTYKNPDNINTTAGSIHYSSGGNKSLAGTETSYGASYGNGDVIGVALNLDDGEVTFYKNNSSQGALSLTSGLSYGISSASGSSTSTFTVILNSGQDSSFAGTETAQGNTDGNGIGDFYYAPPSGFLALCTANLPEPTIGPNSGTNEQSDDYFNTVTYTGNGGTLAVDGFGHQPDLLWLKSRNIIGNHRWTDSSRGVTNNIISNADDAEKGSSDAEDIDSFDSDGFTVTQASYDDFNDASDTYVAWSWKANGGTTSSNTDGSITSTVQANTTAGFSIVLWNGEGDSQATVGHGLGVTPQVIIPKNRGATGNWHMYHEGIDSSAPEDYGILLNATNARANDAGFHNDTAPTSSVFTVGTYNNFDYDYVAYCFAEVEGYSKFGSYTGNGSTDGTFVHTGFRPAWVMVKRTDSADNWFIHDSTRDTINPNARLLYADLHNAEYDASSDADNAPHDFTSNGFKFRSSNANWNGSGNTHIYMAFAEAPFKYANAR